MTLSFSKLNEIAYLYENAVHGEQEVLDEDIARDAGSTLRGLVGRASKVNLGDVARTTGNVAKTAIPGAALASAAIKNAPSIAKGVSDIGSSAIKGANGYGTGSSNPLAKAANTVTRFGTPSGLMGTALRGAASFASGLTGAGSPKPAAKPPTAPKLADIRGGGGNIPARTGADSGGARPPGDNGPKVIPTKPAATAKPAGSAMDQWAKANPKLAAASAERDRTRGTSATTNPLMKDMKSSLPAPAAKPEATPSLGQRAAAMPAMGSSQFKPATTSQATNAAGSTSAAASGSVVPQNDKLAASKKPVDIKASYEYDAYDLVLEYLLSQGHAETVAEAHYVMMEMDAEIIGDIVEEVLEEGDNYDKNRKRAAQRAAARNEARAKGQTGNVPGVGYVTSRRESETYRDSAGTERHKTGARMPEKKG